MDIRVDQVDDLTRTITVTLSAEAVSKDVDQGLRAIRRTHRQKGFRPGKVPMSLIRKRFGASVRGEVVQRLIQSSMTEVLQEQDGIVHISAPEVLTKDIEKDGLSYEVKAESLPELKPADYFGIELDKLKVDVSDEDVANKLEALQVEHTYNQPIERTTVETGDVVRFDSEFLTEDVPSNFSYLAGTGREMTAGGDDATEVAAGLVAAIVDEAKEISMTLGEGEEAIEAKLKLTVKAIYERIVPTIDDELAKDDGRSDNLDGLKELIRTELAEERKTASDSRAKEDILDKVVAANAFTLPEGFLNARIDEELKERFRGLLGPNVDLSQFGINLDELRGQMRPGVESAIKRGLLLEAIADTEDVAVEEEAIDGRIEELLEKQPDVHRDVLRREYKKAEVRSRIKHNLRIETTLDTLLAKASVTEVDSLPEPAPAEGTEEAEASEDAAE
jgi:trigger factor